MVTEFPTDWSTADYIVVMRTTDSTWFFSARSNNGDVLATGAGYNDKDNAVAAAKGLLPGVRVEDQDGNEL